MELGRGGWAAYLSRWELQGIVLQEEALQVSQVAEADRKASDQVAGKVQPHQRKLSQLCKGKGGVGKAPGAASAPNAPGAQRTRPGDAGWPNC